MPESTGAGWRPDPHRLHEFRYFSQGHPTKLVQDGGAESYDEPPPGEPLPPPEVVATRPSGNGGQVWRRAGEQYELIVTTPTRGQKLGAGALNWTATLLLGAINGPTVVRETNDVLSVVDHESGMVALTRPVGSPDANQLATDLKELSVRQFRTKWGIPDWFP